MLLTLIKKSFVNQKRAMAIMIIAVAVASALATSLLALSLDISSKVSKELRSFGANIVVRPKVPALAGLSRQPRYLREDDILKSKAVIFWRHNIVTVAPVLLMKDTATGIQVLGAWYRHALAIPGEQAPFVTGADAVMPWWRIEGAWPAAGHEVLVGAVLAGQIGVGVRDTVTVQGRRLRISGILNTGGKEDAMIVGELQMVQKMFGLPGKVSHVFVSALTTPMDDFAYKDPKTMTQQEYEKWYCTGYVTSIAKQLEDVFSGSVASPIWPVAETEGLVLNRLELLVGLLTALSLFAASLGVATTMIMSLLRRTREVALMKALGADNRDTALIFLAEAVIIGLAGGSAGFGLSLWLTDYIGREVFGAALEQNLVLLPACTGVAVLIAMVGAFLPIRKAQQITPAVVMKGGE